MADRPRLALVTDAWLPQINGVVTTMSKVVDLLIEEGLDVSVVEPSLFRTVKMPRYEEIRLTISPVKAYRTLSQLDPDHVHIVTEGPLGTIARFWCRRRGFRFSSSYHTRFPEYVRDIYGLPPGPVTAYMRWFHGGADFTLVPTAGVKEDLDRSGFKNVLVWSRGVDTTLFNPSRRVEGLLGTRQPGQTLLVYVGRVSKEKSIEDFCRLAELPEFRCTVVGDGPQREELEKRYADRISFVGFKRGVELAQYYASADVMVFPSRTDTFGNVITESMASGTPVAAYPVMGPRDVVSEGVSGALDEDLREAVKRALACDRHQVRRYAESFSWTACTELFRETLPSNNSRTQR